MRLGRAVERRRRGRGEQEAARRPVREQAAPAVLDRHLGQRHRPTAVDQTRPADQGAAVERARLQEAERQVGGGDVAERGSIVTIAVPSGPSARNASTPPVINPGTVVCSQGETGIANVEVPYPDSTGISLVR